MQMVTNFINKNHWPQLTSMVAKLMGTDDDTAWNAIIDAHDAYYRYIQECCRDPKETPADVYKRVGWDDLPEGARWGYWAIVGLMFSTKLYAGLRDEHQQGQEVDISEVASRAFGQLIIAANGGNTAEEGLKRLREKVRECRKLGSSYADILEAVNVERLGG